MSQRESMDEGNAGDNFEQALDQPNVGQGDSGEASRSSVARAPRVPPMQAPGPFAQQMAEFFQQMVENYPQSSAKKYEKLIKYGATEFKGTVDPLVAEQWLDRMERVFQMLECSEADKYGYAVSLLQEDAYDWWKTVPESTAVPPILTWADFLREFRKKYIPAAYVDSKLQEFLGLKQESKSVAEYEREYARLSHYASSVISSNKERCKRFVLGLKPEIREHLLGFQYENFADMVSHALDQEKVELEKERNRKRFIPGSGSSSRKRGGFSGFGSPRVGVVRPSFQRPPRPAALVSRAPPSVRTCNVCGKMHGGVCRWTIGACLNCGGMGHFARDCPLSWVSIPFTSLEGSLPRPAVGSGSTQSFGRGRG